MNMNLTTSQIAALAHINQHSVGNPIDQSLRVTLNFHPDRLQGDAHILQALLNDGVYRSQFETLTSSGGLTAHPGGDRWNWESRIFGNAYDGADPSERPKYGALNYKQKTVGGSPRFGSAHIRLKADVLNRTTFCYPDSVFEPEDFGTALNMSLVDLALADDKDALDDYIEAQIHGDIRLDSDVEALVLDPSYKGTEVEELAQMLQCPIEWHGGFLLNIDEMAKYPEYRGAEFIELGRDIAEDNMLTPRLIGEAANSGKYDSQDVKKVWHYLARFGEVSKAIV